MVGTLINIAAILVGGSIGLIFRSSIPKRYIAIVFQALGLFTLFVGVAMALKTDNYLVMVGSVVMGGLIGTWLTIDSKINGFSEKIRNRLKSKDNRFSEGLVTAFLLYCMGSMTILGAIEEGLGGDPNLLLAKSLMDGISSIALAAGLGYGVLFSVLPLAIYQGGLTLFARSFSANVINLLVNELTAVGGLLLIGMGLNILEITKLKVVNMLPALVVVVCLVLLFL